MKTPTFWNKKNLFVYCLLPFSWIYHCVTTLRFKLKKPYKSHLPVICIGNLTAGGTGKTPVSLAIADILKQKGKNPFFISRGYGGKVKNILAQRAFYKEIQHTLYAYGSNKQQWQANGSLGSFF